MKGLMKVFSSGSVMWRMEKDRTDSHGGECTGSHSVSRLWKRWIDNMKECSRKRFGCLASKENGAG